MPWIKPKEGRKICSQNYNNLKSAGRNSFHEFSLSEPSDSNRCFPLYLHSWVSRSLSLSGRELAKKPSIPKSPGQHGGLQPGWHARLPPAPVLPPGSSYLNVCILHRLKRLKGGGRTETLQTLGDVGYVKSPRPEENWPTWVYRAGRKKTGLGHLICFMKY